MLRNHTRTVYSVWQLRHLRIALSSTPGTLEVRNCFIYEQFFSVFLCVSFCYVFFLFCFYLHVLTKFALSFAIKNNNSKTIFNLFYSSICNYLILVTVLLAIWVFLASCFHSFLSFIETIPINPCSIPELLVRHQVFELLKGLAFQNPLYLLGSFLLGLVLAAHRVVTPVHDIGCDVFSNGTQRIEFRACFAVFLDDSLRSGHVFWIIFLEEFLLLFSG